MVKNIILGALTISILLALPPVVTVGKGFIHKLCCSKCASVAGGIVKERWIEIGRKRLKNTSRHPFDYLVRHS